MCAEPRPDSGSRVRLAASYATARRAFRRLGQGLGGSLLTYLNGPASVGVGAPLATDILRLGPATAPKALIIVSGTHGIEGYCGSACQRAILQSGTCTRLPPGVRVYLVHALNPFGFAMGRRVDEHNVDLNRNFLDRKSVV